jgi:hypothetical protein
MLACPSRTFLYKAHAFGTQLRGLPVELLFLTAVLLLLLLLSMILQPFLRARGEHAGRLSPFPPVRCLLAALSSLASIGVSTIC